MSAKIAALISGCLSMFDVWAPLRQPEPILVPDVKIKSNQQAWESARGHVYATLGAAISAQCAARGLPIKQV